MTKKDKLIARLKSCPKDFTFDELVSVLELLGFLMINKGKTGGSRIKFLRNETSIILHRPHSHNILLEYQLKQVLEYWKERNSYEKCVML